MKTLVATTCAALCSSLAAPAAFLAHIDTTEGRITAELQFDKAPLAVANFVTLAEGTRPHINPDTGGLSTAPYYIGESFYRVVDTATFKIAQTGSGTGTNSGGPGYTFRDEFDPSLRHVPYVLSMANSGPNTNGSQIFLVGNSTPSHLDDVHTVFGVVADAPSQAAIDAILAAGNDGSSISAISFERTDPAAVAFDEMAQGLPMVRPAAGDLEVEAGAPVEFVPSTAFAAGHRLSVHRSGDLATWSPLDALFFGYDTEPAGSAEIDTASLPTAFYHFALVEYPGSPTPALLANRTLVVNAPGAGGVITLAFDGTGSGGTCTYSNNGSTGAIQYVDYQPDGYGATLVVDTENLIALLLKLSFDGDDGTDLLGRHTISGWNGLNWTPYGSGSITLTR